MDALIGPIAYASLSWMYTRWPMVMLGMFLLAGLRAAREA